MSDNRAGRRQRLDEAHVPPDWRERYAEAVRQDRTLGLHGECPLNCPFCGGLGCRPIRD